MAGDKARCCIAWPRFALVWRSDTGILHQFPLQVCLSGDAYCLINVSLGKGVSFMRNRFDDWMRNVYVAGRVRWTSLRQRAQDDKGQALVEYALIIALIAVVAIAALTFLGGTAKNKLNQIGQNISNA